MQTRHCGNEMKKKGIFITIEGIEGVGKSTALRYLQHHFEKEHRQYVVTREPGGTPIAEDIRRVILTPADEKMCSDTELLLMFASRAQHIHNVIYPALEEGKIVVCDRFTDATYGYQGGGRGISMDRIRILEQWVQKGLEPDLTILLDAPPEVGLHRITSRGAKDRIEQEKLDFFERVRDTYLERAKKYARFKIIDATLPIEEVQSTLKNILANYI